MNDNNTDLQRKENLLIKQIMTIKTSDDNSRWYQLNSVSIVQIAGRNPSYVAVDKKISSRWVY